LNADETSIYIDPPTRTTIAPIGTKRVDAVTTGQQKTRVSVMFTASGTKLKPLILVPRKNPLKNWVPPNNVHVVYGTNENFSEKVISEQFIPNVLVPHKLEHGLPKLDIVFDQAPCHTTSRVATSFNNVVS
jgi:hypothetical protein